jgi:protein kinase A
MTAMAEQIVDKPFDAGVQVLKQGDEVEPCLFFVREGAVILSTNDGKLNQRIAAGGYFGVEQLLAPKGSEKSDLEAVLIPAQWTVTVEGNEPCLCGVLPLSKVQSHLDNQFDDDSGEKPDNQFDDDSGEKPKLEQPIEASKPDYEMIKKLSLEAEVTKLLLPDISEDDDVAKLPKKPEPKKTKKSQPKKRKKLEKKKKEDVTNMIMKKRQARRTAVESTLEFHDLEMLSVLGDGQFGEVWLVEATIDGEKEQFALKRQSKTEDNVKEIQRELTVTQHLTTSHPFIVDLVHIFDTQQSVDMLMGLITGGELWDVVHREEADGNWISGIPESQAKFYALVVADTLNYMHAKKYVYRDLKPENVMIDGDGYPIIVDFGFTKVCEDMTFTFCGTPNYVSPEIIRNTGHNAGADHWALGVLIYEMIAGEHPFFFDGMDNMQVFEAICKERHYPLSKVKEGVSGAAVDLVDGLLTKETSRRLGMLAGKANDILNHKWFNGLDLIKLRSKKVKAPWVPRR